MNTALTLPAGMVALNEEWTIAVDSDGVVADFTRHVCDINKVQCLTEISRGKLWRSVEEYDRDVGPFFEALPKMPDADVLMDYIRSNFINYFILTASGYTPKNGAAQKKNWYQRLYGPELVVKVVDKSPDKAAFASPTTILIDDRAKSIDPWVAAGGIGILHTSAESTIAELKRIVGGHGA